MTPAICASRAHCVACRTLPAFREAGVRLGWVASADFDCPHGVTAETAPAVQADGLAKIGLRPASRENACQQFRALLDERAAAGALTAEWLTGHAIPRLPRWAGCGCKLDWYKAVASHPPPADSAGQIVWVGEAWQALTARQGHERH